MAPSFSRFAGRVWLGAGLVAGLAGGSAWADTKLLLSDSECDRVSEAQRLRDREWKFALWTPYSDHVARAIFDPFDAYEIFSYDDFRKRVLVGRLARGEYKLEPFGEAFGAMLKGRTLLDLGCGDAEHSVVPPILAQLFRAKQYVGVDRFNVSSIQEKVSNELGEFSATRVQSDMLEFLVKNPNLEGSVVLLSGIDFLSYSYADSVMGVLAARMKSGDGILIAPGTMGFEPSKFGFEKVVESRDSILYRKP